MFRGVIITEDGNPAQGASISVAALYASPPWREQIVADDKGIFQIDLPLLKSPHRYALSVRWQSQGADIMDALDVNSKTVAINGQSLPTTTIRLRSQGKLRVTLLQAEDRQPIQRGQLFLDTGEVLTANEDGVFQVDGFPMKDHSVIPVVAGRVRSYLLFDTTHRPNAELELHLLKGPTIKGIVTDPQGQPIPQAYLHRPASGTALTLNGWDERCAADGSFEYGGVTTERAHRLEISAPGYETESLNVDVKDTDVVDQKIVLRSKAPTFQELIHLPIAKSETPVDLPKRSLSGVVLNDAGKPVARAMIRWGSFQWDASVKSVATDEQGRFSLVGVPTSPGAILVLADGYAPQFAPVTAKEKNVDVKLSRGTSVRGTVVGTSGQPIAGVTIIPVTRCMETGFCNPIWLSERTAETNAQGEFAITAIPTTGVSFDILKEGFSEQRGVNLKTGDSPNEIQLSAGGALGGMVVDRQGKPVRQFKIRVLIPRSRQPNEKVGGYYAGFDWYGISFTRNDGVFVLTDLNAETWLRLIVSAPGVGMSILDRVKTTSLDQLPAPESLQIELDPFVPLVVRVEDEDSGKPIAEAVVALNEDESRPGAPFNWGIDDRLAIRRTTNSNGEARFEEPAARDGTIVVSAPGYARQRRSWVEHGMPVSIELQPEARVEGEVRLKGRTLKEGFVRLRSDSEDWFGVNLADSKGRFTFDRLPAGNYSIQIVGKNGQAIHTSKFTLNSGETGEQIVDIRD